ncbi:MAG: hypothetical protein QXQ02_00245 [Halobacteria archaeon]
MFKMGHITVNVKISNMEKTKAKEVIAPVDTGAALTVIPEEIAIEII